jgi:peroxiredoxin
MTLTSRILAVAGCALFASASFAVETGEAMPAFSASRLDGAGTSVTAASLRGQVVYVDFWASWCVPCRQSMPALDALYRRHGSSGFAVVGVSKDVSESDARGFMKRVPVSFPLVMDAGDAIARAFRVRAMPSGFLVDRKGVVRRVHLGFDDDTAASLDREIRELLAEAR